MPLTKDRFQIEDSDPEPDLSPMIDCVFILLIFFIVTATFVEEDGFAGKQTRGFRKFSAS
jgi:biopolymer transport protein ExbD